MSVFQIVLLVILILVLSPFYMIVMSACAYFGKILAIRAMFKSGKSLQDSNGGINK